MALTPDRVLHDARKALARLQQLASHGTTIRLVDLDPMEHALIEAQALIHDYGMQEYDRGTHQPRLF